MLSQIRTHIQSWWQHTPLPTTAATPTFQQWYAFDQDRWTPLFSDQASRAGTRHQWEGSFRLVTWNANADAPLPKSRISALLHAIQTAGAADVIFLQEVSREALVALLKDSWVQQNWYISDVNVSAFKTENFISITLVSRPWVATAGVLLGAIWRVVLPSHFGRDALCCDLVFNASAKHNSSGKKPLRIRLINVHLDSLPIQPSLRPQQLAICTSYLRTAGRGVIAGDFNPVLQEDDDLVRANGLVDAWTRLHSNDLGYTWGVHGEQAFPPNRLDKVAVLDLTPLTMDLLQTRELGCCDDEVAVEVVESGLKAHFSDHLGLWCDFWWEEDRMRMEKMDL